MDLSAHKLGTGAMLLAVAAPAEARAVLAALGGWGGAAGASEDPWELHRVSAAVHVVVTGIGKSNAAGAVARVLNDREHALVVSLGVAGALPRGGQEPLPLASVVAASESVFADEGLETDDSFQDCAAMGFPLGPEPIRGPAVQGDDAVIGLMRGIAAAVAPIATVSTCSGTDALAERVVLRTLAVAEGMEGASVGLVAARLGVPFGELRVISNTTGRREGQRWDLRHALEVLGGAVGELVRARVGGV